MVESTVKVVSDINVESTATTVESVDFTSVEVPVPQDANTKIAIKATKFFIIVFFSIFLFCFV
jgi:hypothetical protein